MFLSDCHTHSCFSPDSEEPLAAMIAAARRASLSVLTVTDHCECDRYEPDHYRRTTAASLREIRALAPKTTGLKLLAGVEIGQPLQNLEAAQEVAARPYDFILASLHRARGLPDYYRMDFTGYTPADLTRLMEQYFRELWEMARWNRFDALSHLTYPLRHLVGEFHLPVDLRPCDDLVRELFKLLIQNGKALEVNTSGLRQSLGQTMPYLYYLKLFRQLGGELVTLGSDAHRAADLGSGIREGLLLLAEAGFSRVTYFEKRRPVLVPLETCGV